MIYSCFTAWLVASAVNADGGLLRAVESAALPQRTRTLSRSLDIDAYLNHSIQIARDDGFGDVDDALTRYVRRRDLHTAMGDAVLPGRSGTELAVSGLRGTGCSGALPPRLSRRVRAAIGAAVRDEPVVVKEEALELSLGPERMARGLQESGYPYSVLSVGPTETSGILPRHAHIARVTGLQWRWGRLSQEYSRRHYGLDWHEWLAKYACDNRAFDGAAVPSVCIVDGGESTREQLFYHLRDFCEVAFGDDQAALDSTSATQRWEWQLALRFIDEHHRNATAPEIVGKIRNRTAQVDRRTPDESHYSYTSVGSAFISTKWRLWHDADQLDALVTSRRLPVPFRGLASALRTVADGASVAVNVMFWLSEENFRLVSSSYGRRLYVEPMRFSWRGTATAGDEVDSASRAHQAPTLLNDSVDWKGAEDRYRRIEEEDGFGVVVIDDLLTAEALDDLQAFAQMSTLYHETKPGFYTGAYFSDGYASPAILALADALRRALPNVIGELPLVHGWSYKYGQRNDHADAANATSSGVGIHADQAAVNVNIWLTESGANLDPDTGGLIVWTSAPSPDKFVKSRWGAQLSMEDMDKYVADHGGRVVRVPHRQNRAVIFHSDLFHKTDSLTFKPGYTNRRINLTLLFGFTRRSQEAVINPFSTTRGS